MKFFVPIVLVLLAHHTAAQIIDFNGDGCYDYNPNEAGWTSLPYQDDYTEQNVDLGFSFQFGGNSYTHVNIDTNGHLLFDNYTGGSRWNPRHSFVDTTEYVIAPYWADVFTPVHGHIRYKRIGGNKFVVLWEEVASSGGNTEVTNTFQVVLSSPASGEPQVCFCYDLMEWARGGDVGLSAGSGKGFSLATFTVPGTAWNGVGSNNNGLGHLDGHSYCFNTDIVDSESPETEICSTNDDTIEVSTMCPSSPSSPSTPTSGPTSGPTFAPTNGPTQNEEDEDTGDNTGETNPSETNPGTTATTIDFNGDGCYDYNPNEAGWTSLPYQDDYTEQNVDLGFSFPFGGNSYTHVNIDTNGHLLFDNYPGGSRWSFRGGDFVDGSAEYVIAPYWADVHSGVHGHIRYKSTGGNKFVVLWEEVASSGGNTEVTNTFQVVLSSPASGEPQVCFCYDLMEWARGGDVGLSAGSGKGFSFGTFTVPGTAWNGVGSNNNGIGHLDGHSYCFNTDIVDSESPETEICSPNDDAIEASAMCPNSPTSGPTSGPTSAPTNRPTQKEEENSAGDNTGGANPSETNPGTGGDPHITTWTNEHFEYHGQCDLVLTKDAGFADGLGLEVHIRTKLVRYWSYIKNVAIKIGNDILEIEGSADANDAEAHYWINFEYQGELEEFAGFPITQTLPSVYKRRYTIDLSSKYPGQSIVVELYKEFVRVRLDGDMETFGDTVGLMGDYVTGQTLARDGITVMNDFTEFGDEWQVLPYEPKIFHEVAHPQFPELCIKPEDPRGDRKRRLSESNISIEQAEAACAKSLSDELSIKDCMYDILATQDMDMVGAF